MTIAEKLLPQSPLDHPEVKTELKSADGSTLPLEPDPSVFLPTAPSTYERYAYKDPSTWWAYWGLLAFLCIFYSSCWFLNATHFWGYIIYIFLTTAWTLPHFLFVIIGKKFDFKDHIQVIQDYAASFTHFHSNSLPDSRVNQEEKTVIKTIASMPSVDVFIPTCGEDLQIIENTFAHAARLNYRPLNIYALDDGGNAAVKDLAAKYGLIYLCRPNRGEMKKAGNLLYAYKRSQGDFILVLDADFAVSPCALDHLIPWMASDSKIAIVQTPQYFETDSALNWSARGAAYCQEVFYRAIQPARDSLGRSAICVGTNALYRRKALAEIGGFYQAEASEDVHNGVALLNQGWSIKYLPILIARGLCPDSLQALFRQHYRWCTGSLRLMTSALFWQNRMPFWQKMIYFCGACYYPAVALALPISLMQLGFMIFYFHHDVRWYVAFLFLPKILLIYLIMPLWNKANWGLHSIKSAITFSWAYLIAIWDFITQGTEGWIATGAKAKSSRYTIFRRLLMVYCTIHFLLLIPVMQYEIQHFIPLLAIHGFSIYLNLDLLMKDSA